MTPIYSCFYTRNTLYEQEAERLRKSLDRLGLPHDLRAIDSRGSWAQNAGYTATHLVNLTKDYPDRPIVYLDADAVVWKRPDLFEDGIDCDLAVHYCRGRQLANGTLYLSPTKIMRRTIELYSHFCAHEPGHPDEQALLQRAIDRENPRVHRLDTEYCYIRDINGGGIDPATVIIEHLQASRESSNSTLLPSRRQRLSEIGG